MSSQANATGFTSNETKALTERQPSEDERQIISSVRELYSCQPKTTSYTVYAEDSVFHDPVGIAKGIVSIKAQFNGLAKIFPKADIPKFRVLENPPSIAKSTILIDQDVSYYRDPSTNEPTKTVNSLLTIKRNSAGLISEHIEEWDHEPSSTGKDGFLGKLNEWRKLATAGMTNATVGQTPPSEK